MILAVTLSVLPAAGVAASFEASGPEFVSSYITDQRGDVARIPVRTAGSGSAEIRIISRQNDYEAKLTLRDRNHDGIVTVEFNTYLAGTRSTFRPADDGDDVRVGTQTEVDGPIPTGEYRLTTDGGEETAGLKIEPRSTDGITTMVAPEGASEQLRTKDAVTRYRRAGNLTPRQADGAAPVARHDTMVLQIRASGLSGPLAAQPGSNDTERFRALVGSDVLSFDVVQANPGPSQERAHLLLNSTGLHVVADSRNDRYSLVVDTSSVRYRRGDDGAVESGLPLGAAFSANVTVAADSKLGVDAPRSAETVFEIVERSATLRTHAETGQYFLRPAAGQVIEGATTIAPGSTVEVRVSVPAGDFGTRRTITVDPSEGRGRLSTTLDLSNLDEGATLEATVRDHRGPLSDEPVSVTVRSPAASLDEPRLVVENSRLYAAVTADLSRGGVVTVRANNESGRLLGAAAAEPGQSTVQILLDDLPEKDTPLVVTATRDLDSDGEMSPTVDVPYEQSNSPRPVQLTMALYTLPPSPTPTPSPGADGTESTTSPESTLSSESPGPDETTEPPTRTPSPGDGQLPVDVPGFGSGAALVVLVAVLLLFGRRE